MGEEIKCHMSKSVALMLKRFAASTGLSYKSLKLRWTLTPGHDRGKLRLEIERYLNAKH